MDNKTDDKRRFTVDLDINIYKDLAMMAAQEDTTKRKVIEEALQLLFEIREKEKSEIRVVKSI